MRDFAGPQPAAPGYWLRFYPDYSCEPGLWVMNEDGDEEGLEDFEQELPRDLHAHIAGWISDWGRFHKCDVPDATHRDWTAEGYRLLTEIRTHLEPLGWRVEPAFDETRNHSGKAPHR
jgi:hypothetical protein